jgi:putative mRNA 3-end processing factor
MQAAPLISVTDKGLFCQAGDFYIDPWRPVATAVLTHGHSDHARAGSSLYYAAQPGVAILNRRLGTEARVHPLEYGEPLTLGTTRVSLHPAGHVLGSAQVRIETAEQVWVVSGDYKRDPDPTCAPFEPQACDTFITEATFALPVYRWRPTPEVVREIHDWWQLNRRQGLASVLCCYALGKAQRVLAELCAFTNEAVYVHGAVAPIVEIYRQAGISMVPTQSVGQAEIEPAGSVPTSDVSDPAESSPLPPKQKSPRANRNKIDYSGALILCPPSASGTPWMRRFGACATGFCSGWMRIRGNRRRQGYDRGFVLSDHTDWPGLLDTIEATGAKRILATHGYSDALVKYLREQGKDAAALSTEYGAEE